MLVVAHDAGLLRIPGEWSDHGTTNYKPPRAYGTWNSPRMGYIGRYLFVTAAISNAWETPSFD